MFLIVCLILYTFHFSVRMNTLEKSVKNWAEEVIDECNSQLKEYYVAYKSKVTDWLSDFIDTYCYTKETDVSVGLKNNDKEDEKTS